MALHRLMDAEFGVPEPAVLDDFYQEIGLTGGPGNWGGSEQPDQIRIVEAPYRQFRRHAHRLRDRGGPDNCGQKAGWTRH